MAVPNLDVIHLVLPPTHLVHSFGAGILSAFFLCSSFLVGHRSTLLFWELTALPPLLLRQGFYDAIEIVFLSEFSQVFGETGTSLYAFHLHRNYIGAGHYIVITV